jgi:ABC-type branched-chain amino acid transport systems, periplasmic component
MKIRGFFRLACLLTLGLAAAPAAAQDAAPIKIGALAFTTGKFGSYGKTMVNGVEIAVDKINAEGGLLGRKLEVDYRDTASEATQAISNLRRFDAADDIVGVVGPVGTPELLAILPVTQKLTLPVVTVASFAPLPHEAFAPGLFRVSLLTTPETLQNVFQRVGKARKVKQMGLLYDRSTDNAQVEAKHVRAAGALDSGIKLVAEESYAVGDKNFSAVLDKMLRAKVDILYLAGNTNEVVLIMQQARARGFAGPFVGSLAIADPKIAELAGAAAVGTISFSSFFEKSPDPMVSDFARAFHAKFGDAAISPMSAYGYDATLILADAIRNAKVTERGKVIEMLGTTSSFKGVSGTYTFDGKGDNKTPTSVITEIKKDGSLDLLEAD